MRKLTFIIVFFISSSLFSQVEIDWLKLRDVYYKSEYAEDLYGYVQIPYYGEAVEPLDNKEDTNITPNLLNNNPNTNPEIVRTKLSKIIIVDN